MIVTNPLGMVKIWKKGGGGSWACTKTLKEKDNVSFALAFSPNGEMLALGGGYGDKQLELFSVADDFPLIHTLEGYHCVNALSFSPDGSRLCSASDDDSK